MVAETFEKLIHLMAKKSLRPVSNRGLAPLHQAQWPSCAYQQAEAQPGTL